MPESPPAVGKEKVSSNVAPSVTGSERQVSKLAGSPFPVLGILLVGSCGGFLAGRYHQSFLWIVILLFISYFVLKRRLERLRIYHRHAVEREAIRQRLDRHVESTEWLNFVMERLWSVLEPTLSVQITEKLNSLMETNRPSFLDSLELTELTLGSSPPLITGARVHPRTDPEIIHLDVEICFVPNESDEEEAPRGRATTAQWNSKIVLTARVGKGIVSMDMPVLMKELLFSGKLRVELELAPTKPYVNSIRLAFMELPKIDFILRPLKSFDVMDLPGLSSWLTGTINDVLGEKLVDPNAITIPLARSYSSVRSIGVLKVSVFQIRGVKLVGNVAEPFVRLQVGGKVKAVSSRINPDTMEWNQVFYVLVHTVKEPAIFVVVGSTYSVVGSVSYPLSEIEKDAGASADVWRTIVGHESSKIKGELNFGVEYFPAAEVPDPEADLNFESGIVQITLHQIKDLDEGGKPVSCCYELYVHPTSQPLSPTELPAPSSLGTNYYRSKNRKRALNPTWEDVFEVFLEYKDTMSITLVARHTSKEDVIFGHWSAPFDQLLNRTDWFQFTSPERAQFYASFIFRPIRVDLSQSRVAQFSPCMGVIQIKVLSASGLRGGKGGHAAKVQLNGRLVGKTAVSLNECAPVWNRTFLTMVKEKHEKVTIEVRSGEKGHLHGRLTVGVAELLNHPGYEIEQHECLEGEGGEKLSAKLRFTMALFLIDRDRGLGEEEGGTNDESEPLLLPPDSTSDSNVGVLEVRSVTAEGLKPSTIRSLNYVQLAFDDGEPCYKTCPLRPPLEGSEQSWSSPAETIVSHVDEVQDLNLIVMEAQGIKEEEVGRLDVPFREMRAHKWYNLEGEAEAKIKLEARFHPIPVLMEPEVEETGTLQVELLNARDLIAVDSGGTSDPFCVLRLNGQKFYKSQVVKECLNPTFQESASIEVRQKDVSVLQIELRDWNKVMASRTLGHVTIELQNLPADQWQELSKPLENVSSGILHFSLKFVPSKLSASSSRRPSRRASNVIAVSHSRPPAVDSIPEEKPKEQFQDAPTKDSHPQPLADDGSLRKSLALTLATAAAIRITIFEMQLEGSGGSGVRVEDCRIKVKRDGQTIYKTRTVKQGPFRWNESFSLDPDAIDPRASFSIIPVWLHSPELSTTLTLADLDLSGGQEQRIELPLQTAGSVSGRLVLLCGLSMDNSNLIDSHHRRRRFSIFNRS